MTREGVWDGARRRARQPPGMRHHQVQMCPSGGRPGGRMAGQEQHEEGMVSGETRQTPPGQISGALLAGFSRDGCRRRTAGDRSRDGLIRSTSPGDPTGQRGGGGVMNVGEGPITSSISRFNGAAHACDDTRGCAGGRLSSLHLPPGAGVGPQRLGEQWGAGCDHRGRGERPHQGMGNVVLLPSARESGHNGPFGAASGMVCC
jgi:hypothetical protein